MFCLKNHESIVGGKGENLCSLTDLFSELHHYWMSFPTEMFYKTQVQTILQNNFSVCAFVPFAYLCFWGIITLPLMWAAGEGLEERWQWKRWRCLYYCNSGEKSTEREVGMEEKIIYRQSTLMSSARCWISVDFSGFSSLCENCSLTTSSVGIQGTLWEMLGVISVLLSLCLSGTHSPTIAILFKKLLKTTDFWPTLCFWNNWFHLYANALA